MLSKKKIFLVSKPTIWTDELIKKLSKFDCEYFNDDSYMDNLDQKPDWVFFFHWSKIVPKKVFEKNRCVVLHVGNLPMGRGGSPIQNQIMEGIIESRVNALVMGDEIDAGDIYCSLPVTLQGSLTDIWLTLAHASCLLINQCVENNPAPKPQKGTPQVYKRNKDNMLPLVKCDNILDVHRFIQMLDGETYPSAYLKIGKFRLEFTRSSISTDGVLSDVLIRKIDE